MEILSNTSQIITPKTKFELADEIQEKQLVIDYFRWKVKTRPWSHNPDRLNEAIKVLTSEMIELETQLDNLN